MNHDALKDLILPYRDGELPPDQKALAAAHLAECPECRGLLDGWERAGAALFRKPAVEPSEVFVRRVMARVQAAPASPWWKAAVEWARLRPAAAGAAGVLAAASALFLVQPRTPAPVQLMAEAEFISDLMESPEVEGEEPDTVIEEYFL